MLATLDRQASRDTNNFREQSRKAREGDIRRGAPVGGWTGGQGHATRHPFRRAKGGGGDMPRHPFRRAKRAETDMQRGTPAAAPEQERADPPRRLSARA
jgi:hypothetical protein